MKFKIFAFLIISSFWLASCQQPSEPVEKSKMTNVDLNDTTRIDVFDNYYTSDVDLDWDGARIIALRIVPGNCRKVEKTKFNGVDVFMASIITQNNTIVNIFITVKTATIVKVESDTNDDVNLTPKKGYKKLKEIIKQAQDALKKYDIDVVVHWEISYDKNNSWHYIIKIKSHKKGMITIMIKAKDGKIIYVRDDTDKDISYDYKKSGDPGNTPVANAPAPVRK